MSEPVESDKRLNIIQDMLFEINWFKDYEAGVRCGLLFIQHQIDSLKLFSVSIFSSGDKTLDIRSTSTPQRGPDPVNVWEATTEPNIYEEIIIKVGKQIPLNFRARRLEGEFHFTLSKREVGEQYSPVISCNHQQVIIPVIGLNKGLLFASEAIHYQQMTQIIGRIYRKPHNPTLIVKEIRLSVRNVRKNVMDMNIRQASVAAIDPDFLRQWQQILPKMVTLQHLAEEMEVVANSKRFAVENGINFSILHLR